MRSILSSPEVTKGQILKKTIFSKTIAFTSNSMVARKNSKKIMGSSPHDPVKFSDQIRPKVNSFVSRGHQKKNYCFYRDGSY